MITDRFNEVKREQRHKDRWKELGLLSGPVLMLGGLAVCAYLSPGPHVISKQIEACTDPECAALGAWMNQYWWVVVGLFTLLFLGFMKLGEIFAYVSVRLWTAAKWTVRCWRAGTALGLLIIVAGCYDPHAQESAVVRELEAAGAGNLNTYTQPGLAQWFSSRPQLAKQIAGQCEPLAVSRGANWATSAEGTVCLAANRALPPPQWTADQRIW